MVLVSSPGWCCFEQDTGQQVVGGPFQLTRFSGSELPSPMSALRAAFKLCIVSVDFVKRGEFTSQKHVAPLTL